jgi:hypothetical protein
MREVVTGERIAKVMAALGAAADTETHVYFTGGVTAVLVGWRASTVDIDMIAVPDSGALLRSIPALKESLSVNVELASPAHFIPAQLAGRNEAPSSRGTAESRSITMTSTRKRSRSSSDATRAMWPMCARWLDAV